MGAKPAGFSGGLCPFPRWVQVAAMTEEEDNPIGQAVAFVRSGEGNRLLFQVNDPQEGGWVGPAVGRKFFFGCNFFDPFFFGPPGPPPKGEGTPDPPWVGPGPGWDPPRV